VIFRVFDKPHQKCELGLHRCSGARLKDQRAATLEWPCFGWGSLRSLVEVPVDLSPAMFFQRPDLLFSGNIAIALARWPPSFGDAKYRETVYQIEDNKLGYSRGLIVGPTVSCVAVLQRR
jgi:hypothetical protein